VKVDDDEEEGEELIPVRVQQLVMAYRKMEC
jgi:hypothetical protein